MELSPAWLAEHQIYNRGYGGDDYLVWFPDAGFSGMIQNLRPLKSLGYAVVGMIVVLGAYTIIATVGNAVNNAGTTPGVWSLTPLSYS